jgi:hypothetical protein
MAIPLINPLGEMSIRPFYLQAHSYPQGHGHGLNNDIQGETP